MEWTGDDSGRVSRRTLLMAAMAVSVLAACGRQVPVEERLAVEGRPFPPLKLDRTSGNILSTSNLTGKMLVLNVWATWCPPCRSEMPGLERLSRALDPRRFAVIGMSTDDDERLASEFLMQNGITFANFFDKGGRMAKQLGMKVYPETFLIAPDGTLLERLPGLREWDSNAMMAHLEEAYLRDRRGKMHEVDKQPKGL